MAFVRDEYCPECEKTTMHTDRKCNACYAAKEKARIAEWNQMDVDKRLSDLRRRVEELERGPVRFS